MKSPRILLFDLMLFGPSALAQSAPGDEHWDHRFGLPGVDGFVGAIATNGALTYAAGQFTSIGNVLATNIAVWDGQHWSALGPGTSGSGQTFIYRIAFGSDGEVYAGGQFTTAGEVSANNVARWDGVSWSALGAGVSAGPPLTIPIGAVAVSGSNIYFGGSFTNAGGQNIAALARWDGSTWSAVGGGIEGPANLFVTALLVDGSNLYVGGNFTNAGGVPVNQIARWDGTNWSSLGSGVSASTNASVSAIVKRGSDLFVAGNFTNAGGIAASNIAKWDGTNWSALGSGLGSPPSALAASGSNLFAGGQLSRAGAATVTNIARWNGTNWSNIGGITTADPSGAVTAFVYALAVGREFLVLLGHRSRQQRRRYRHRRGRGIRRRQFYHRRNKREPYRAVGWNKLVGFGQRADQWAQR